MCFLLAFKAEKRPEHSSVSNGAQGGNNTGKKCELLAPVAAQSERLPMWKGLAVNSPLRWAWSRGNASQSPVCSPTWEQLQPPSASSSWWLPEGSTLHPSISGERLLCYDREGFQGLMKSVGLLPWLSVNMRACLFWWNAHWHEKKTSTQHNVPSPSEMILIRIRS